ncbi:hypothetical protein JCM5350_002682 [Sporobolomyces pararoseus]
MLQTLRTQARRQCTCLSRSSVQLSRNKPPFLSSTSLNFSSSSSSSSSDLPWFVDPSTVPSKDSPSTSSTSTLSTAPIPTPPPLHLSPSLYRLHNHLSTSPFFEREGDGLSYIHAREADPLGSWCDWVIICTLKPGRERSLRGAIESIRTYLASNPIEFETDSNNSTEQDSTTSSTSSSTLLSPFSPPMTHPSIHGLPPTTASKHQRSRSTRGNSKSPAPTRQDQTSGWALLDAVPLTIPSPLTPLYSYFPLLLISDPDSTSTSYTTPAPSLPTLWALGPPPSSSSGVVESLDPLCRKSQAFLRFKQIKFSTKWVQDGSGAPGGSLPSLHLQNGDLIDSKRVDQWIQVTNKKQSSTSTSSSEEKSRETTTTTTTTAEEDAGIVVVDPIVQAYTSLVETSLLPAVISAIYLIPSKLSVTPQRTLPFLSDLVDKIFFNVSRREERINQVKQMRGGGKAGKSSVLDLEETEREAVECLEALEEKYKEQGGDKWFLGNNSPTQLDALIYSLLSIISILPEQSQGGLLLRTTLDKQCPGLTKWYKSLEP